MQVNDARRCGEWSASVAAADGCDKQAS